MINLVNSIVNRDFVSADSILEETVELIMAKKLEEAKKMCAAKMTEQGLDKPSWVLQQRGLVEDDVESGEESSMARSELNAITKDAKSIMSKIKGNKELEAWTQSKITKAADYLNSVADYMGEENLPVTNQNKIPVRTRAGTSQVPTKGKVVSASTSGAKIDYSGMSKPSPAEREPVGQNDRMSVNKAVELTKKIDPVGQKQSSQHASNAAAAVKKGYSTRYMPNDPNFQKRAMAAPVGAASRPAGPSEIKEEEIKESDDMGPVKAREKVKDYRHKTSGKEISSTKHPGEEWELVKEETLDEARIKIIKARIRGGKIQRRKKVSNVAGMTLRGGKLQRMSPAERRRRKMGARRAKIKRKSKMNRALMKRQRSLRKRKALGL